MFTKHVCQTLILCHQYFRRYSRVNTTSILCNFVLGEWRKTSKLTMFQCKGFLSYWMMLLCGLLHKPKSSIRINLSSFSVCSKHLNIDVISVVYVIYISCPCVASLNAYLPFWLPLKVVYLRLYCAYEWFWWCIRLPIKRNTYFYNTNDQHSRQRTSNCIYSKSHRFTYVNLPKRLPLCNQTFITILHIIYHEL